MRVMKFERGDKQIPISIRVDKRTKALIDAYHKEQGGSMNKSLNTLLKMALDSVFFSEGKEKA